MKIYFIIYIYIIIYLNIYGFVRFSFLYFFLKNFWADLFETWQEGSLIGPKAPVIFSNFGSTPTAPPGGPKGAKLPNLVIF